MEIATTLNNAIESMKSKREEIQAKKIKDSANISELTSKLESIEEQIEILTNSVTKSERELLDLDNMISETETGYQKIIQAGETLMSIVSQNLPTSLQTTSENGSPLDAFKS